MDKQSDYSARLATGWILTYVLPASIPPISPSYLETSAGIIIIDHQAKPFLCVDQASTEPIRQASTNPGEQTLVPFSSSSSISHWPPSTSGHEYNTHTYYKEFSFWESQEHPTLLDICVACNCSLATEVYLYDLTWSPPETHPPPDFSSLWMQEVVGAP